MVDWKIYIVNQNKAKVETARCGHFWESATLFFSVAATNVESEILFYLLQAQDF